MIRELRHLRKEMAATMPSIRVSSFIPGVVSRGTSAAVVWSTYHATNSPSALNASPSARHPHPLHKLAMNYRRLMSPSSVGYRVISDAASWGASAAVVWNPYRATNSPSALNASPSARHPHPLHKLPPSDAPQLPVLLQSRA